MAKQTLIIKEFTGGASPFEKRWVSNSARKMRALRIFDDPSYITPSIDPNTIAGTGTVQTLDNIVKWIDHGAPWDNIVYFNCRTGSLYTFETDRTWTRQRTGGTIGNGTAGQGMKVFDNYLYYATSRTIGRWGRLDQAIGSRTFNDNFLADDVTDLDQSDSSSGNTFTVPTTITENATNRQNFTPLKDPWRAIEVNLSAKGTGNWTLTVHDANNNVPQNGTVTITNASLPASGLQEFAFSTAIRLITSNSYHWHMTSTVADGTLVTGTAADENTAQYKGFFGILVDDTDWHPMLDMLNGLAIGNERYIAFWDQATYDPNKIVLPPGAKVRALAKDGEFLVAAVWLGDNDPVRTSKGRLYYWDGVETTFNFFKETPGLPMAIMPSDLGLVGVYGIKGQVYRGIEPFKQIAQVPDINPFQGRMEICPGGITNWNNRIHIAVGYDPNDDSDFSYGIHEIGSVAEGLPEVIVNTYPMSDTFEAAGNSLTEMGAVRGVGRYLWYSYRDAGTQNVVMVTEEDSFYGTFVIRSTSITGRYESLIFDNENPDAEFLPLTLTIKFQALPANITITPIYRYDRAAAFTSGTAVSTTDAVRAEQRLYSRTKELEIGFTIASTAGQSSFPKITAVELEFDDLVEERRD